MLKREIKNHLLNTIHNSSLKGAGYVIPKSYNAIWFKMKDKLIQQSKIVCQNNKLFIAK
jgi:hypothetical protein